MIKMDMPKMEFKKCLENGTAKRYSGTELFTCADTNGCPKRFSFADLKLCKEALIPEDYAKEKKDIKK